MSAAEGGGFTALDWGVVLGLLAVTTIIGERMAGKPASMRDFFLGGRKLPWYAVSASIVATEISAVTFVSFPSVVFRPGGNLAYLQIVLIGSFLARLFVGYVLVPAYFRREIYSPYDYVGERLGAQGRGVTTALFTLGGILAQSARVYLTAVVLEVILHRELAALEAATGIAPLVAAIVAIGIVAVVWTWIGGIATVIWTDVILFLLFLVGIAVTLWTVAGALEGGLGGALREGYSAGKFDMIDTSLDASRPYTIWVALFVASWGQVGPYGCDQLLTQRLFCCKDARDARRAIVSSIAAVVVVFLVGVVGVALWAYYRQHPMTGEALALFEQKNDRVFPIFITEVVRPGLKGLVIAGAFAAAISSLDSIMAALSQTTLSALYLPRRKRWLAARGLDPGSPAEERRTVLVSRRLVVGWGVLLCAAAVGMDTVSRYYESILDLALAMAGYTQGALLAAFFLAFLPLRARTRGLLWSAPLSVMAVFATAWHQDAAVWACVVYAGIALVAWHWPRLRAGRVRAPRPAGSSVALAVGVLGVVAMAVFGELPNGKVLAWPYYVPIGSVVCFVFALLLDDGRESGSSEPASRDADFAATASAVAPNDIHDAFGVVGRPSGSP